MQDPISKDAYCIHHPRGALTHHNHSNAVNNPAISHLLTNEARLLAEKVTNGS
jgi:hypothetical protein